MLNTYYIIIMIGANRIAISSNTSGKNPMDDETMTHC